MSKHDDHLDLDRHNFQEEIPDNEVLKQAFSVHDSLYDLYRSTYKDTSCGPSVGALIQQYHQSQAVDTVKSIPAQEAPFTELSQKWYYSDDLRQLGTWDDMDAKGQLVLELSVGSIVEGVDHECETMYLNVREHEFPLVLREQFGQMVEDVDEEAQAIWESTHGCETCAEHWVAEGIATWEGDDLHPGNTPVWKDCPECKGEGTIV